MTGWPARFTGREIAANLRADFMWIVVLATYVALLVAVIVNVETAAAADALADERTLVEAGAGVVVVTAGSTGTTAISTESCMQLGTIADAIAAGGLRSHQSATIPTHPGAPFRLYGGTGQIGRVLDPTFDTGSAQASLVADELASSLGIRNGDTTTVTPLDQQPSPVGPAYAFNPARHTLGGSMWIVDSYEPYVDECWIEYPLHTANAGLAAARAAFAADPSTTVAPLLGTSGIEPAETFAHRPLADVWPIAGLLVVAPSLLVLRLHRIRIALYRSFGAGRITAAFIVTAPLLWTLFVGTACGISAGALVVSAAGRDIGADGGDVTMRGVASTVAVAAAVLAVAGLAGARGDVTNQLKDRV